MALYCGIDLHSNNSYVAILDQDLKDVLCRRVRNDLVRILEVLEPYRGELSSIAVESTYNWYWLVDGLHAARYDTRLVNTTKAADYSKLKYTDDRHDARWLARLLALRILPEGYIMPPQERALRDLLRRRSFLVRERASVVGSMKTIFARSTGRGATTAEVQRWDSATIQAAIADRLVAESIIVMLPVLHALTRQIRAVEKKVLEEGRVRREFQLLGTAPGIGVVLTLTIMCETGDIARFASVGDYGSYCRCVKTARMSNLKKKGKGNPKNGNKYLSWAYSEAACHAVRYDPLVKRYRDRKRAKSHPMVAARAIANKMARGCYYVMRDHVPFDSKRAFC